MTARWRVLICYGDAQHRAGADYATEAKAQAAADRLLARGYAQVRVARVDLPVVSVLATVPGAWAGTSWQVVIEGVPGTAWVRLEQGRRVRMAFARRSQVGHEWWGTGPSPRPPHRGDTVRVFKGAGVLAILRALGWDVAVQA